MDIATISQGYGQLSGMLSGKDDLLVPVSITVDRLPPGGLILGRADNSPTHLNLNVDNEANSTISREHFRLDWNGDDGLFALEVLSKNGVVVDQIRYEKGMVVSLKPKAAIRAGNAHLYWLPAKTPKGPASKPGGMSYMNLVSAAGSSIELGTRLQCGGVGVTKTELVEWIVGKHPEYADQQLKTNLDAGVYNQLSKAKLFAKLPCNGGLSKIKYVYQMGQGPT
jgi:hypothetical protein